MRHFKIKISAIVLLVLFCTVISSAQVLQRYEYPHWYVSAYGGINSFMTEYNVPFASETHFSLSHFGQQAAIGGGYNLTAQWSLRGLLGWSHYRWYNIDNKSIDYLNGEFTTVDLMYNISNALYGFSPYRIIDIQLFIGTGVVYRSTAIDRNHLISPLVSAGIQGIYHISQKWEATLNLDTKFYSDKMNNVAVGRPFDNGFALMVGFNYHIIPCHCKNLTLLH
jgi:hypothetical protein